MHSRHNTLESGRIPFCIRGFGARPAAHAVLLAVLALCTAIARADIYTFTDADGTPHFSDVPDDNRYRLFMHVDPPRNLPEPSQSLGRPRSLFNAEVRHAASVSRVDEALLHAVIAVESNYNPHSLSRKGAMGLMQLMPDTARRYQVSNAFDPAQNIHAGAQHLGVLLAQFDNNVPLALAAYNAGEDRVRKYGGRIPPFAETAAYVPKVMRLYRRYRHRPD